MKFARFPTVLLPVIPSTLVVRFISTCASQFSLPLVFTATYSLQPIAITWFNSHTEVKTTVLRKILFPDPGKTETSVLYYSTPKNTR